MLIDKIINFLYRLDGEKYLVQLKVYESGFEDIYTYLKIFIKNNKKCNYLFLNIFHFFNIIITFIVFLIFWFFDIKIFDILGEKLFKYIWFMFMFYIVYFVIKFMYSIYLYVYYSSVNLLKDQIQILFEWINFFLNLIIFCYIFNLDYNILIQYNILLIFDQFCWFLLHFYFIWLNIRVNGLSLMNFLMYPYLFIIIIYFYLRLNKNWIVKFGNLLTYVCLLGNLKENDEEDFDDEDDLDDENANNEKKKE